MKEIETIKRRIEELFDKGDAAKLEGLYNELNQLMADLSIKRTMLSLPEQEPEPEIRLEMVNKDRFDKEDFE